MEEWRSVEVGVEEWRSKGGVRSEECRSLQHPTYEGQMPKKSISLLPPAAL